ncbi:hypothetical protein LguiA_003148 [Lonicera macranthoides]
MEESEDCSYNKRIVDYMFNDFKGRRAALLKALTTDLEQFLKQCRDHGDKKTLMLYGYPDEQWELRPLPADINAPALGLHFCTDMLEEKDWLSHFAIHCDAWLDYIAFYFGGTYGFEEAERNALDHMMIDVPDIYKVVTGTDSQDEDEEEDEVEEHLCSILGECSIADPSKCSSCSSSSSTRN